jgi:hypothetical protein
MRGIPLSHGAFSAYLRGLKAYLHDPRGDIQNDAGALPVPTAYLQVKY